MILLDTDVVSELVRPRPHAGVVAWVAGQPRVSLNTTSITRDVDGFAGCGLTAIDPWA